jgi:hypothetical protein
MKQWKLSKPESLARGDRLGERGKRELGITENRNKQAKDEANFFL